MIFFIIGENQDPKDEFKQKPHCYKIVLGWSSSWLFSGGLLTFRLFSKFSLWSFIVMKQLLLPLICNLFWTSYLFKIRLPSLLILSFVFFSATFLYLDVTAFCKSFPCSFLVGLYKLVALSSNVTVLSELRSNFICY